MPNRRTTVHIAFPTEDEAALLRLLSAEEKLAAMVAAAREKSRRLEAGTKPILTWVQVAASVWQVAPTIDQPWKADVIEWEPGKWGAAAENTVTRRALGTVNEYFPTAEDAMEAINRAVW